MLPRIIVCLAMLHCCIGCTQVAVTPSSQRQTILAIRWHGPPDADPKDVCVYVNDKPVGYGEKGWQRAFDAMRRLPRESVVLLVYDGDTKSNYRFYKTPFDRLKLDWEFEEIVEENKLKVESASWAVAF